MSHVASCDHRLHLPPEHLLYARDKVDLEIVCILQDLRVEQDLVRFAESKVDFVLVELFLVRLCLC